MSRTVWKLKIMIRTFFILVLGFFSKSEKKMFRLYLEYRTTLADNTVYRPQKTKKWLKQKNLHSLINFGRYKKIGKIKKWETNVLYVLFSVLDTSTLANFYIFATITTLLCYCITHTLLISYFHTVWGKRGFYCMRAKKWKNSEACYILQNFLKESTFWVDPLISLPLWVKCVLEEKTGDKVCFYWVFIVWDAW